MVVSGRMKIGENVEIVTATTPHGERRGCHWEEKVSDSMKLPDLHA